MMPRQQAEHMIAIDPPVRILFEALEPKGRPHIAMRLQHAKQAASGLSVDTPGRMQAKAVIVPEVERLYWRIWNGKAQTHGAHAIGSARSCMSSRANAVAERRLCLCPASCGVRCVRLTTISAAEVHGSSIMPDGTEPACA